MTTTLKGKLSSNFPFGLGFLLATFSLFLEPFLGTKKSPFLTPFAQPNQWENYKSYQPRNWNPGCKLDPWLQSKGLPSSHFHCRYHGI
jgi:hypothetical protein